MVRNLVGLLLIMIFLTGTTMTTPRFANAADISARSLTKTVAASQDPPIQSVQTILESQFKSSDPILTKDFYLPQKNKTISDVILAIEWNDENDPSARYLNVIINGQKVWSDNGGQGVKIDPSQGSIPYKDIMNLPGLNFWGKDGSGNYLVNKGSVILTTQSPYRWDVRVYVYVEYTAATHIYPVYVNVMQWYRICKGANTAIHFPTSLPDGIVDESGAVMLQISASNINDGSDRTLWVIENNNWYTYTLSHTQANTISIDITEDCSGFSKRDIAFQMLVNGGDWGISAYLVCQCRPSVAPDVDPIWVANGVGEIFNYRAGSIYDSNSQPYQIAGTFSTTTTGSGDGHDGESFFTGVTATYPKPSGSQEFFGVMEMKIHIDVKAPDGTQLNPSQLSGTGFYGSNSGTIETDRSNDIGQALLSGASLLLGVADPALGALFGIEALIVQYGNQGPCSINRDSTGICMDFQEQGGDSFYNPQSMLLKWSLTFSSYPGLYHVHVQTTVSMVTEPVTIDTIVTDDYFDVWHPVTVGALPKLTILAQTGGDTDPAPKTDGYYCSYGSQPCVTAFAASGYVFAGWTLGGSNIGTGNPTSVLMKVDQTLQACFNPTLSISISGSGTTKPDSPGTYPETYNSQVTETATPGSGYYFDYWLEDSSTYVWTNSITVTMNAHHDITACFVRSGGGGGCPYVYTWNGSAYVKDNNILPASENGNGTDTKDYYLLQQSLMSVLKTGQQTGYSLQIGEFENNVDFIDQVKLMSIDHSEGTSIAVTQQGQIISYENLAPPKSCVDNNGNNELPKIISMDGNVSDASTYYQGNEGDWLVLDFGKVTGGYANLVLRDDMKCAECIDVQIPNATGGWQTINVLNPRDYWSIEAVNMAAYLPKTGDFVVRLLWTQTHRLDYVGLDTTPPSKIQVNTASPKLAVHSTLGDVTARLMYNDGNSVELVKGQQITLWFKLPIQTKDTARSFILYTDGYYYTVTP